MSAALGNKRGFTLTELLVVVAILVLLTSIVVPNVAEYLTRSRMQAAEVQIDEIKTALSNYHAAFGTYPGDVFPTEDLNNNGILDSGEDTGVDLNGDGVYDYACNTNGTALANGRLDRGDGVVNIDDLEWALRTTAKNGPFMESIPLDPWGNRYVYYAPLDRPTSAADLLYINPDDSSNPMRSEDTNRNGRLDGNTKPRDGVPIQTASDEDRGIGKYATSNITEVNTSTFGSACSGANCLWAGQDNGILDHGDDDNKNGTIQYYWTQQVGGPTPPLALELGNADVSPDGLAKNLGYYIYSVGRNGRDETATGYEDIGSRTDGKPNNIRDMDLTSEPGGTDDRLYVDSPPSPANRFDEDLDGDLRLDTGYEDTGLDGIPGTKDRGEDDGQMTVTNPDPTKPDEEFGTISTGPTTWHYNRQHTTGDLTGEGFDIGGDDINSWNKKAPWREHASYGG